MFEEDLAALGSPVSMHVELIVTPLISLPPPTFRSLNRRDTFPPATGYAFYQPIFRRPRAEDTSASPGRVCVGKLKEANLRRFLALIASGPYRPLGIYQVWHTVEEVPEATPSDRFEVDGPVGKDAE